MTRKALGRGLGALIPGAPGPEGVPEGAAAVATASADGAQTKASSGTAGFARMFFRVVSEFVTPCAPLRRTTTRCGRRSSVGSPESR